MFPWVPTNSLFTSENGESWNQEFGGIEMRNFTFQDDSLLHISIDHGVRTYNLVNKTYRDVYFLYSKLPDFILSFEYGKEGEILAGTHNGIYRSIDKGFTWDRITEGKIHKDDDYVNHVKVLFDGRIISYGDNIFSSLDNGNTWDELIFEYYSDEYGTRKVYTDSGGAIYDSGVIYITNYYGFFVISVSEPTNVQAVFEYNFDPSSSEYPSRYDHALGFSNGDVFLIEQDLKKGWAGKKNSKSSVWDFYK